MIPPPPPVTGEGQGGSDAIQGEQTGDDDEEEENQGEASADLILNRDGGWSANLGDLKSDEQMLDSVELTPVDSSVPVHAASTRVNVTTEPTSVLDSESVEAIPMPVRAMPMPVAEPKAEPLSIERAPLTDPQSLPQPQVVDNTPTPVRQRWPSSPRRRPG